MPKILLYTLFTLFILPSIALANNSVSVKSDTSSNYQSSNNYNNETSIRIETNGEVKEYHGSGEDVNIQSDDGKTTVRVNNNGTATTNSTSNSTSNVTSKTNIVVNSDSNQPSPSPSPSASATPEATVAGVFIENSEKTDSGGFWEYLKKEIEEFFSIFS